jgi:hypothetical protein
MLSPVCYYFGTKTSVNLLIELHHVLVQLYQIPCGFRERSDNACFALHSRDMKRPVAGSFSLGQDVSEVVKRQSRVAVLSLCSLSKKE